MLARLTTVVLLCLVVIFQYQIWLGPRNRADLAQLQERLLVAQKDNAEKVQINAQLQAEVDDLQSGLETVEEKARYELNMVKNGEILVQYID
jgi:cell division protein FtsB